MKYEPKKTGKKPEGISLILFSVAMITTLISNAATPTMQWIFQIATILLLGIFIYILVRFSFTDYMYEIKAKSKMETARFADIPAERLQLYIHKKQSRRGYAAEFVCNLDEIESIEEVTEKKEKRKGKKFLYLRNMSGGKKYMLTVKNDPLPILLYLELNEDSKEFLDFLKSKI